MSDSVASSHLSIGEVLALVQEDFPDVTISKIRFLESQGLIAPERTASGYRKFYEADIDRLRWILAQQRDHFLPLKVIKKMLDQGVDVADGSESQPSLFSAPASDPSQALAAESDRSAAARSSQHPAVKSAPRRPVGAAAGAKRSAGGSQPSTAPSGGPAATGTSDAEPVRGQRPLPGAGRARTVPQGTAVAPARRSDTRRRPMWLLRCRRTPGPPRRRGADEAPRPQHQQSSPGTQCPRWPQRHARVDSAPLQPENP